MKSHAERFLLRQLASPAALVRLWLWAWAVAAGIAQLRELWFGLG